jgi:hypothetical protein
MIQEKNMQNSVACDSTNQKIAEKLFGHADKQFYE